MLQSWMHAGGYNVKKSHMHGLLHDCPAAVLFSKNACACTVRQVDARLEPIDADALN